MKKCVSMFIGVFLLSGTFAHAGGENSLQVLFQIGDTIVSPGNLSQVRVAISKMLEQQTSCMNDRGVTVDSMMASLLSVCQQRRNLISQELPTWHSLAYKVVQKVKSILESSASIDEELEACLITVEDMKSILAQNDKPIKVALNPSVNLDACIRGIAIDEKAIDPFESVYSDSGDSVYVLDQLGDGNDDTDWIDEISFRDTISSLSDREKKILNLRFIHGLTQMEVSNEIGISQAQVSRIEKGVLDKIKN